MEKKIRGEFNMLDLPVKKRPRTLGFEDDKSIEGFLKTKQTISSKPTIMNHQNNLSLPPKKGFRPTNNLLEGKDKPQFKSQKTAENTPDQPRKFVNNLLTKIDEEVQLLLSEPQKSTNNNHHYSVDNDVNGQITVNPNNVSLPQKKEEEIVKELPSLESIAEEGDDEPTMIIFRNNPLLPPKKRFHVVNIQEEIENMLPSLDPQLCRNLIDNYRHFFATPNNILYDFKPVIVKHIKNTDIQEHQGRLSIPQSGVESTFLTEDEENLLKMEEHKEKNARFAYIDVIVRGRHSKKDYNMGLTRRYYTSTGATSKPRGWSNVLNHKWKFFREENRLREGDLILVVAFRTEEGKLCFAITDNK